MKLYTICVRGRPVVTLRTGADDPLPDEFATDPQILQAIRESQAVRDKLKALSPGLDEAEAHDEIYDALDTWLGQDLRTLQNEGRPLWGGDMDDVHIREARVDEAERWHLSRRRALDSGEQDAGHESWHIFLVPVSDPTDDDLDEEDEEYEE